MVTEFLREKKQGQELIDKKETIKRNTDLELIFKKTTISQIKKVI